MSQIPRDDLAGFLTGIPSRPAPVQHTGFGSGMLNQMNRNVENMRNVGYRLRGEETPEARQAKALASLDLNTAEGLQKLAQAQKATGDIEGAAITTAKALKIQKTQARKKALLKIAEEQNNDLIKEYIMEAGDSDDALQKAQEVLFRKPTAPKGGEKPSGADIKRTKILLATAGEEAKGEEGGIFGAFSTDWNDAWNKLSENKKELIATQVAEYTNKLIKLGDMDLSQAQAIAIKKVYTDNLTETGLFEFKGESRLMTPDEVSKREGKNLEDRLSKY